MQNDGSNSTSIGINISSQKTTETYENNPFNNSNFNSFYSNIFFNSTKSKSFAYSIGLNYNNSKTHFVQLPNKLYDIQSYGIFSSLQTISKQDQLTLGIGGFVNLSGVVHTDKKIAHGMNIIGTYKLTESKSTSKL